MNQNEQDAMQIIKTLLRPIIPILVELIKEYEQDLESEKKAKNLSDNKHYYERNNVHMENDKEHGCEFEKKIHPVFVSEEQKAFEIYQELPDKLKKSMSGIINGESLSSFLEQTKRIESLWEFCKYEVQRPGGLDYSESLNYLFVFFFHRLVPAGVLYSARNGEPFDANKMISQSSGKRVGIVRQNILVGFSFSDNELGETSDSLEYKAVVLVR